MLTIRKITLVTVVACLICVALRAIYIEQVLAFCIVNSRSAAHQPEVEKSTVSIADWRHDIDEIVKDIRLLHPEPFAKTGRLTFLREVEALKAAVPSLTEEQRVVRAMRLVALIGDGHTQLEPDNPTFAYWYPVRLYEFTDGFFVTSAHKSVADLAGAQVLEIAGHPVSEVVAEARKLMGADNVFDSRERMFAVHSAGLMKGLGYAMTTGSLKVKFKLRDGKMVERELTPSKSDNPAYKADDATFEWQFKGEMYGLPFGTNQDWISAYKNLPASAFQTADHSRPPHLTQRSAWITRPMPQQDAFYVQINYLNDTTLVPFFQGVMREVDQAKPRRLILDLRYNFGGDGSKVNVLIQEFIKRADNKPWKELYLLTGRKTFSAAIMALNAFVNYTQFSIIGEPAGGALNHFGDPTSRNYSRTGLHLNVSTMRWQLSDSADLSEFIPVDVPALFSFADYVAGRDPAVDPILRGEEMRSLSVIALSDGGAAARKAYEDRKARFAQYDWWTPPREIDLRNAGKELLDQKRVSDAVETCKLNAEIHPDIWNVWYNLGRTQGAAGLMKERLGSYRCVMEIAPDNWNVPAIRRFLAQPGNEGAELPPGCPAAKTGKTEPRLENTAPSRGTSANEFKPGIIRYGATVAEMEKALAGSCKTMNTRRITPPFQVLKDIKDKQMQIDCDGFQFLGKPRWAEFVFGDDSLEMVWIMTTAEEEQAILKLMTEAHGAPTRRNDKFVAFPEGRTALRIDRPEVLFYSEKLAPRILPWFEKNTSFK